MAHAEPDFEAQEIEKLLGRFLIHLRKQRHRIVLEGPEHGRLVSVGEGLPLFFQLDYPGEFLQRVIVRGQHVFLWEAVWEIAYINVTSRVHAYRMGEVEVTRC